MRERTKETIKDGFGSLISNAAAMRGAKNGPLWLTIAMFILAVLLPVIPLLVAQLNTNGSSFLKSYSYGLERYVTSIAMDLKNNRLAEFKISEDHLLSINENGNAINFADYGSANPYATYENTVTKQYDFIVYLSDATTAKEKTTVDKAIAATHYGIGSTTTSEEKENVYRPSYMVLFTNGSYVCVYGNNSTKALTSSYSGDYKTIAANNDCLGTLLTVTNKDGSAVAQSITSDDYVNGVYANFKKFLNKSYDTLKIRNTWATIGIYAGIFFGINVLMGLLMWLLTRGKNNPNNYLNPWITEQIQARLALAPALIAMIAGFFLVNQTALFYIITIGLRTMWISMKELRPIQA